MDGWARIKIKSVIGRRAIHETLYLAIIPQQFYSTKLLNDGKGDITRQLCQYT